MGGRMVDSHLHLICIFHRHGWSGAQTLRGLLRSCRWWAMYLVSATVIRRILCSINILERLSSVILVIALRYVGGQLVSRMCMLTVSSCQVAMHRDKFPEKIPFRLTRMLINAMEVGLCDKKTCVCGVNNKLSFITYR